MAIATLVVLLTGTAHGGIVSGIVKNNGTPQPGKTLAFVDESNGRTVQTTSDERGHFTILLPPGFFALKIDRRACGLVQSSSRPVRHDVEISSCR